MDSEGDGSSRGSWQGDNNNNNNKHGGDHRNNDNVMSEDAVVDDGLMERNGSCAHNDDELELSPNGNTVGKANESGDRLVGSLGSNCDDNHATSKKQADSGTQNESKQLGSDERADSSLSTAGKDADGALSLATVSPGIPAGSPPRASTKRVGLKKWRRIKREPLKDGNPSSSSGKILKRGLQGSVSEPSTPLAPGMMLKEESRGSVSSVNAIADNTEDLICLPYLGLGSKYKLELENSTFSAGTDSDNSENRSSKSSTAASAPKFRSKHQGGKNSSSSGQRMHPGKGLIYTDEKPRGGIVVMEKASTVSVPESDSRSSDSVNSNARQRRRPGNYESEQGADAVAGGVEEHIATLSESVGEADDISSGDAQLPWLAKRRNRQSDRSWDPLVDSVVMLQSAQEALEREIGKFGELGKDLNFLGEEWSNATDLQIQLDEIRSVLKDKEMKIAALEATTYTKHTDLGGVTVELQRAEGIGVELEALVKQRIEAEIEHLVITRATESSIIQVKNQIKILDEQRSLSREQEQTAKTVEDAERKAAMLKYQVEEFETDCYQDLVGAEEMFSLHKRVMRATACFLMQLFLLVLVFGLLFLKLSLDDSPEVIPT
ncbi:WPP domain-interacting protein 1-like protein [Drosera capensis]